MHTKSARSADKMSTVRRLFEMSFLSLGLKLQCSYTLGLYTENEMPKAACSRRSVARYNVGGGISGSKTALVRL